MDGGGFEPPKQYAADLQSVPFGHSGIHPNYALVVLLGILDFRSFKTTKIIISQHLYVVKPIGGLEPSTC